MPIINSPDENMFNSHMQTIEYIEPFTFHDLQGKSMMMKRTEVTKWTPLNTELTDNLQNSLYEFSHY